ncbi:hypothetical protein WJR50_06390 [Catalinimonas sp. 4WD22]|uniref:hypothetical protein n=1 Tax=Catalinimonas locisalis TaxID=3133978 RepID=UPI0031011D9B
MQEFEEYLSSKKIDAKAFKEEKPEMWENWRSLFYTMHPNSFTQQKLFLINPIRRQFPIKENVGSGSDKNETTSIAKPKPKFKIPARPKKDNN